VLTADSIEHRTLVDSDDAWFTSWRARELSRLDRLGIVYLDYTGAALYPETLVRDDATRLAGTVFGNPHSEHTPSRTSTSDVERARRSILEFVGAPPDEYTVVLTANASAACRLVGESFAFREGSALALTADNHNSVNGLREFARHRGARLATVALDETLRLREPLATLDRPGGAPSLFAYPVQSNFSGVRHPLDLVSAARERGWFVLLDAASFVPTCDLSLRDAPADFVALSLYKIAGYPTGIGALVARREALDQLHRPWFAGGTVQWVSVDDDCHSPMPGAEAFEDGTPSFLAAGAVPLALAAVTHAGRERLGRHLTCLTSTLLDGLLTLRHTNGQRFVRIIGPESMEARGATIAISLRDATDRVIPYWSIEADARSAGIAVRGGCFCNPGCAESAFRALQDGSGCRDSLGSAFTVPRYAACLGDAEVGAIRISLGLGTVRSDIDRALEFFARYV
jgi:selenocysteine lyase/cysteine desulfurase